MSALEARTKSLRKNLHREAAVYLQPGALGGLGGKTRERPERTYYVNITKTYLYNFDPFKPHFYIVELGFTRAYIIFLISVQKPRL